MCVFLKTFFLKFLIRETSLLSFLFFSLYFSSFFICIESKNTKLHKKLFLHSDSKFSFLQNKRKTKKDAIVISTKKPKHRHLKMVT